MINLTEKRTSSLRKKSWTLKQIKILTLLGILLSCGWISSACADATPATAGHYIPPPPPTEVDGKIDSASTKFSFQAQVGKLYDLRVNSTNATFTLKRTPTSPSIASIALPGDGSNADHYSMSFLVGTTFSAPVIKEKLDIVQVPSEATGLRVSLLDTNGNPIKDSEGMSFYLTFSTDGKVRAVGASN